MTGRRPSPGSVGPGFSILGAENGLENARGEMSIVGARRIVGVGAGSRADRGEKELDALGLIRTILALIVLLILAHVGLFYAGVEQGTNGLTAAIYSLGDLLESPAVVLLNALPLTVEQREVADTNSFYVIAFTAAAGYFILYLLLGVGRRT
jgi:hypothetical protein